MAVVSRKTRIVGNPAARRNGILGLTLNPGKNGAQMAKKKAGAKKASAKKKAPALTGAAALRARIARMPYGDERRNPGMVMKKSMRRKNPGMNQLTDAVLGAGVVVAAAVASKLGAQMVLGDKNTGIMGYVGNVAAGVALFFAAKTVTRNPTVLSSIASGTTVQIVLRGINDFTPLGRYVQDLGMGDYQVQSYVTPQILRDPHASAEISIPRGWGGETVLMSAAAPQDKAPGMAGLYGGSGRGLY